MPVTLPRRSSGSYSLQGCDESELKGRFSRAWDSKLVRPDALFGSELTRWGTSDAAAGRADAARAGARLSMAHIDTNSDSRPETSPFHAASAPALPSQSKTFSVYKGGSLARTPGVQNSSRSASSTSPPRGKKQMITRFSPSSRNTFKNKLATVRTDAVLYTMCLSLPGYVEHFTHSLVKMAFLRFMKRLVAKCSRDALFADVSGFYKQELQSRLALHFHMVLAGITPENHDPVWQWCVDQWIECVMAIPGMPPEIVAEETRKMRDVHLFSGSKSKGFTNSNFQLIRGDFHSYFAKYLGKPEEDHVATSPIPGRWWGSFNSAKIPFAELRQIELPERVAVHSHRVARKIRQVRADNSKHSAICRKFGGMSSDGKTPGVSRQQLERLHREWVAVGGETALDTDLPGVFRRLRAAAGSGLGAGIVMFTRASAEGVRLKDLVSGFRFPSSMKYSAVTLTGRHVPAMMLRVLQYAGDRAKQDQLCTPF